MSKYCRCAVLAAIALLMSVQCYAETAPKQESTDQLTQEKLMAKQREQQRREALIAEVAPAEVARFIDLRAKRKDTEAADALVALVDKTCELSRRGSRYKALPPQTRERFVLAYPAAWETAIVFWRETSDTQARRRILDGWDRLMVGHLDTGQLLALDCEWERAFLTEKTVKLFKTTKNAGIVSYFCAAFGNHGEGPEEALLKGKLPSVKDDPGATKVIESALAAIANWKRGMERCPPPGIIQLPPPGK